MRICTSIPHFISGATVTIGEIQFPVAYIAVTIFTLERSYL